MKKLLIATSLLASIASTGLTMNNTFNNPTSNVAQTLDPNEVWDDLRTVLKDYIDTHETMRNDLVPLFADFVAIYKNDDTFPYLHKGTKEEHADAIEARISATAKLTAYLKQTESKLVLLLDLEPNFFLPSMMREMEAMRAFLTEVRNHITHFHSEVVKKLTIHDRESVDGFVYVTLNRFVAQISIIQDYNNAFIANSKARLADLESDLEEAT